jgi:hypothetical protein
MMMFCDGAIGQFRARRCARWLEENDDLLSCERGIDALKMYSVSGRER